MSPLNIFFLLVISVLATLLLSRKSKSSTETGAETKKSGRERWNDAGYVDRFRDDSCDAMPAINSLGSSPPYSDFGPLIRLTPEAWARRAMELRIKKAS